jgi:RNA polymerase sigma-70 factor, ECF subfamily
MNFHDELVSLIPVLRRFARALCGDSALADDLTQDCVERALVKSHLYDPARPLKAWLFAILRNIYISGLRRNARAQVVKTLDQLGPGEDAVAPLQEPNASVRDIADALAQLPDAHREAILLVALEDMSYRDVAEIAGVPIGTVMSRLSRARASLRAILEGAAQTRIRRIK